VPVSLRVTVVALEMAPDAGEIAGAVLVIAEHVALVVLGVIVGVA
jgi:hypothetical protein